MAFCRSSVALKPGRQKASDASAIHWNEYKYSSLCVTSHKPSETGFLIYEQLKKYCQSLIFWNTKL